MKKKYGCEKLLLVAPQLLHPFSISAHLRSLEYFLHSCVEAPSRFSSGKATASGLPEENILGICTQLLGTSLGHRFSTQPCGFSTVYPKLHTKQLWKFPQTSREMEMEVFIKICEELSLFKRRVHFAGWHSWNFAGWHS